MNKQDNASLKNFQVMEIAFSDVIFLCQLTNLLTE